MTVAELIAKKRDGGRLKPGEIADLIRGYTTLEVPDYQMSALLMAIFCRDLDAAELTAWTGAMVDSGRRLRWSRPVFDKHSTGGVGDKVTLVLAPLLAAAGLPVAKMSGRGLGHTGGTIDKLEAIPGFQTTIDADRLAGLVERTGVAVVAQGPDLAPADGLLYALRDVTGTVEHPALIASSVMSKKIAGGASYLVLDVKVGRAALLKERSGAEDLARRMLGLAKHFGLRARAVLTAMDDPLGRAVGNALEVREAIATLAGEGPADLTEVTVALGAEGLQLAGLAHDVAEGREILRRLLTSGAALERFRWWVMSQGGDATVVTEPERLGLSPATDLTSPATGYLTGWDGLAVGQAAAHLGAGRQRKNDPIDPGAGIYLHRIRGERVRSGERVATLYGREPTAVAKVAAELAGAFGVGDRPPSSRESLFTIFDDAGEG